MAPKVSHPKDLELYGIWTLIALATVRSLGSRFSTTSVKTRKLRDAAQGLRGLVVFQ